MRREEIIARLREKELALRKRGVARAARFGSRTARRTEELDSDHTDIMITGIRTPRPGLLCFDFTPGLKRDIAEMSRKSTVDVVNRDGLKPYIKPAVMVDAIYAF